MVDDGETNRQLLSLVLRRMGLDVAEAANGQEALETVASQPVDVILMDMQMPIMDGYEATRRLRESGMSLPIVALTANAMQGDEQKCRDAGCDRFLTKPLDLDKLAQLMIEILGVHSDGSADDRSKATENPIRARRRSILDGL